MRYLKLILAILVVAAAGGLATMRQAILKVPHVRVGPLHADLPMRPNMRFFVLGDTGTGGKEQYEVAASMEKRCATQGGADGILLLGDNAYPHGFESVEDPQWHSKVVEPYGSDCLSKLPIYAVLGNHDYQGNPGAEIEYSLINKRWYMPNRFYSVRFGDLLKVITLDTNVFDLCFNAAFCGVDFMLDAVAQRDSTWTFVIGHHPIASSSSIGFNYRGGLRGMILRPYLCQRIDAYMSGHSHHLEHRVNDCRMDVFVAGGGGGDLYEPRAGDVEAKFVSSTHGFLEIELDRQHMRSRFVDSHGTILAEADKAATP